METDVCKHCLLLLLFIYDFCNNLTIYASIGYVQRRLLCFQDPDIFPGHVPAGHIALDILHSLFT